MTAMKVDGKRWAALAGVFLIGACVEKAPSDEEYDQVAASIGALVASDSSVSEVGAMSDAVSTVSGDVPAGLTAMGEGSYQGTDGGLTYSYSVSCLDAGGNTMSVCDATTDAGRLEVDWSGNIDLPNFKASVDRSGDWTLSGVQAAQAVFTGQGDFDVSVEITETLRPVTHTYDLSYAATYNDVLIRVADGVVIGGSINYDVDAHRTRTGGRADVDDQWQIDAIVTFASDGSIALELDGSRTYSLNVRTGAVTLIAG